MSKPLRRRERQVPAGGQLGFELGASDVAEEPPKAGARGRVEFKQGTRRLFLNATPLKQYLEDAGLGWVARMRALLEDVDVSAFIAQYDGTGRHPYHPRMILGLILYGMLERKWSLRELESLAARDVGAWWICAGLRPDHSTIGRFMVRHADLITDEFFIGLAKTIASRLGLKAGEAVIDGTTIEAAASHFRTMKAEALKEAAERAQEEAAAKPDDAKAARKASELDHAAKVCAERDAARAAKNRLGKGAQVAPNEPEAVVQKLKDGSTRPSFKPSAMTHESGLVTGVHVEATSETAAVEPLVEQHRKVFGEAPRCLMLDAGYFVVLVLSFLFEQDIDVLCPRGRAFNDDSMERRRRNEKTLFLKNEFKYDEQRDVYTCPAGRLLVLQNQSHDANGAYRKYRSESCSDCPLKAQCTKSSARTVKRYEGDELKDAMAEVMRQPKAKERFRRRSLGERPFAGIKERQGLTRFHRRGLKGARLESALHFAAWNIRLATGALTMAQIELWRRQADGSDSWLRIGTITVIVAWTPL